MDPFTLANFGLSLLTGAMSAGERAKYTKMLEDYFKPGGPKGSIKPDENIDFTNFGSDFTQGPNSGANQAYVHNFAQNNPAGGLRLAQIESTNQARQRQTPYFDEAVSNVKSGALADAARVAETFVKNPEQLQSNTFDRLVGMAVDSNRAAAATRARQISENTAATGMSSDAAAAMRQQSGESESEANAKARRDSFLQAQDYTQSAARNAAAIGGAYNDSLNTALYNRASLEQPTDFGGLADIGTATDMFRLGSLGQQSNANANFLTGVSGLFNQNATQRQAQQAQIAASKPSFNWGSLIAPVATAGISLAVPGGGLYGGRQSPQIPASYPDPLRSPQEWGGWGA